MEWVAQGLVTSRLMRHAVPRVYVVRSSVFKNIACAMFRFKFRVILNVLIDFAQNDVDKCAKTQRGTGAPRRQPQRTQYCVKINTLVAAAVTCEAPRGLLVERREKQVGLQWVAQPYIPTTVDAARGAPKMLCDRV